MTTSQAVRAQYESLPYPPRDPRHELRMLHRPIASELKLVNHAIWRGHRRADVTFRALDAGCGTGDNAVFLAMQLQSIGGEVVALDLSEASLGITRERAAARGLTNITTIHGRIEDLPSLDVGRLDFAVCNGVLHHLPSPKDGLEAIRDVLKPEGGAHFMVYGRHGRSAIYQLQELFRLIAPASMPADQRIRIVRTTLAALPPTHWRELGRNGQAREVLQDADIFDLYLHSLDRAYTVQEIYALLSGSNMRLVRWLLPHVYSPELYAGRLDLSFLSAQEKEAAAELLNSRMGKHAFFVTREEFEPPPQVSLIDESAVPTWLMDDADGLIRSQLQNGRELRLEAEGLEYRLLLDPFRREFLKLVDGTKPLALIMSEMAIRLPKVSPSERWEKWRDLYQAVELFNVLALFPTPSSESRA